MIDKVMDYCEGGEIMGWKGSNQFSPFKKAGVDRWFEEEQIRKYMCQLVQGLNYSKLKSLSQRDIVHNEKNVIHRDIKPQNILITKDNKAKLSDFGVSQIFEQAEGGDFLRSTEGTYQFFAPECCDRK